MEEQEKTCLTIELTNMGNVVFKDGEGKVLSQDTEQCVSFPDTLPDEVAKWLHDIKVRSYKASPIKVYVDTGDKVVCYKIDSITGKYLGPC